MTPADPNKKKQSTISKLMTRAAEKRAEESAPRKQRVKSIVGDGKAMVRSALLEANMLVPGSKLGANFVDQYRRVKRPLISNAFGKTASLVENGNLILITSSVPGEGKTHSAINLALSISQERDRTVLLIDCDVARQGTSRMLGLNDRPGLVDVLLDEDTNIGDVMMTTDVEGLRFVSAGRQDDYVTELLASRRMSELVEEVANRYDDRIIIFDAPPLLATPQTPILATLVGQVVFIIESGKTPQAVVDQAIDLIPEEQAVSILLNKSEAASSGSYYYYGYYEPYE